jgi:hypothetical protein
VTASLRERLEAKARRTASVPVLVGDAAAAEAEVATFRAGLDVHLQVLAGRRQRGEDVGPDDDKQTAKLRKQLGDAQKRLAATVVNVEIQSLPPDEWDALCADLPDDPETGGFDITDLRAAIMAACCVDPELQDSEWWEEQFRRPEWSKGELLAVNMALLNLNLATPSGFAGKG